jgi:hypothetical protein
VLGVGMILTGWELAIVECGSGWVCGLSHALLCDDLAFRVLVTEESLR